MSPPCCAECGKQLRTLQRRGQDWYCAVCAVRPGTCSACGKNKVISTRDRQGLPRCEQCRDPDDRDPLLVLTSVVQALDPSLSAQVIASAAGQVFARANQLRRLSWVVEDQPGLLTGDGAQAPVPGVLRLIDCLCGAGAEKITRPACPRCRRVTRLAKRHDGQWVCRGCVARTRAVPCSRCGSAREPAARDADGGPLCPNCLVNDPANLEDCVACGRRSRVATRTADGPLCGSCRPWKIMDCAICGRTVPCAVSTATGQPWCTACRQRWARCSGCGQVRAVRGGTVDTPLCAACLPAGPFPQPPCVTCGGLERLRASGRCTRCTLDQRLRQLLDDGTGRIRAELRVLHQTLASADRPRTVLGWLSKNAAAAVLASLARGERPLTHHALDQMPPSKPVEHLRAILVATGALPARDEHLTRLEHWINATLGDLGDRDDKELLHRYAVWHLLRLAAPAQQRHAGDLQPVHHDPPASPGRHRAARLAARPRPDPGRLPASRHRRLADQPGSYSPGRSRAVHPLGHHAAGRPRDRIPRRQVAGPVRAAGPRRTLEARQTAAPRPLPQTRRQGRPCCSCSTPSGRRRSAA